MEKRIIFRIAIIIFLIGMIMPNACGEFFLQNNRSSMIVDDLIYNPLPDWVSDDPHYSTGAALADIDKDGWLDIVIADGNDILEGHLNVYYNSGNGVFPTVASWQSDDIGYNGHLDVADVNGDGWLDVAVSYLGEFYTYGPIARVYLNNNGVLSSLPDWSADIIGNAFGVDFGDMNNDGRPDLAVATGWSYTPQHYYHNYVYLNVDGALEETASWVSDDMNHYMGCLWVDADNDGWLDLVGIGTGQNTKIYRNLEGVLETTASWQTTDSPNQDGIMLTAGDVNLDGFRDLFATDNTQLGGSGLFKQYTGLPGGFFETTYSWSYYDGYGSAVALADVNGDDTLDLATGAWWDYTRIFLNHGAGLPNDPSWNSGGTSVVEKIVFGDVGPALYEQLYIETFSPDGNRRLFYLPRAPIQRIHHVYRDGVELLSSEYTFSRDQGWITINNAPSVSLEVEYFYSPSLDMVISNWDGTIGNYLYYNRLFDADLECEGSLSWTRVVPGETVEGSFEVINSGESDLNWEIESYPAWGSWSFDPMAGTNLSAGGSVIVNVEVVAPDQTNTQFEGEVKVVNSDNSNDFCIVDVDLKTKFVLLVVEQSPVVLKTSELVICRYDINTE